MKTALNSAAFFLGGCVDAGRELARIIDARLLAWAESRRVE